MELTGAGFVGIIVVVEVIAETPFHNRLDAKKVLGSAFVVDKDKGLIVTCDHVLPKIDRDSDLQFAFYTVTQEMQFQVHLIDRTFCEQWEDNDLIALRLVNKGNLRTYSFLDKTLNLGSQIIAMGMPVDFHKSSANHSHVVLRGFTGFIVTGYPTEYETDTQFIVTMSGCPVIHGRKIAGVAHTNRQYSRELITEETIEVAIEGGTKRIETHKYNEVLKLGVFYKAASFTPWLTRIIQAA